jgi:two-component system cell cycle sensor histidine kinase/response regulator CckA
MSGHPGAADVMRRLPADAVLLPKPFDPETLASRVREVHARRSGAPAVLVVHDDTATLYWLQRCLTRAGYRVVTDSDLFQALSRVRDDRAIRLLVADWHLGYVDAAMLVHEVRARDPQFPVLIVTMWPERYERIRARLPDDVQVVFSPMDEAQLLSVVGALWRERPPAGAS